jgi:exonuclease SbcD
VIIAGDIFDTGTPPSYAREIYNQFVVASTDISIDEQVFTILDKLGQPGAILFIVPFIRARDVLQSTAG